MKTSLSIAALLAVIVTAGAGCDPRTGSVQIPPAEQQTTSPAPERGFGLLPAIYAPGALGSPEAISARLSSSYTPPPMPAASEPAVDAVGGMVSTNATKQASLMIAPDRPISDLKPAPVTYDVQATLPTWEAEDDVRRVRAAQLSTSGVAAVATANGLPAQAIGSNPEIRSVNISWKGSEGMTWNFDSFGRSVSFWKETDYRIMADNGNNQKIPPKMDNAEAIRIADDFLTRSGFGTIARGEAEVENPYGNGVDPAAMGCPTPLPYVKEGEAAATTNAAGTAASEPATDAKMMIAPCGWYPQQITVSYTARIGARNIHDVGGWPFRAISVQIDLHSKQVTGGNVWLTPEMDSSRYPLISAEEAMKRLQAGGRSPIYPYYDENVKEIKVTIERTSLGWMRYDAWSNNRTETYFVPALIAEGTVMYSNDRKDPYKTIVPLVADDAFGSVDQPTIMPMDVRSVPYPPAMPVPAPVTEPKQ